MPRDLTYAKYIATDPKKGHMRTTTDVIENVFPVPSRLFSNDGGIKGFKAQAITFNTNFERKGFNNPINLKVGIGTRPSDFRVLAVYNGINPSDGNFNVAMTIPADLPTGYHPLWYSIEPVNDATRSIRSEYLAYSASDPTVRSLQVEEALHVLTINLGTSGVNLSVTVDNSLVFTGYTTDASKVFNFDSTYGKSVYVSVSKAGFITQEDSFYMNSNISRSYTLSANAYWPTTISGMPNMSLSATQTVSDPGYYTITMGSLANNPQTPPVTQQNPSVASRFIINQTGVTSQLVAGRWQHTYALTFSRVSGSIADTIQYSTAFSTNEGAVTSTNGTLTSAAITLPSWPTRFITDIVNFNLNIDSGSMTSVGVIPVTIELGSDFSPELYTVAQSYNAGFSRLNGTADYREIVNGRTRVTTYVSVQRNTLFNQGNSGVTITVSANGMSVLTGAIAGFAAQHINAVSQIVEFFVPSQSKVNVIAATRVTPQSYQIRNYTYTDSPLSRNMPDKMGSVVAADSQYRFGFPWHTVKFPSINTQGRQPTSLKLRVVINQPQDMSGFMTLDNYNRNVANNPGTFARRVGFFVVRPSFTTNFVNGSGQTPIYDNLLSGRDFIPLYPDIVSGSGSRMDLNLDVSKISSAQLLQGLEVTFMSGAAMFIMESNVEGTILSNFNSSVSLALLPSGVGGSMYPHDTQNTALTFYAIEVNL